MRLEVFSELEGVRSEEFDEVPMRFIINLVQELRNILGGGLHVVRDVLVWLLLLLEVQED